MMVTQGKISDGERCLVLGASGGVGTGCVLLAKMFGANALRDHLAPFMIRHTKSQRIGGQEALALPASVARTVMLTMSSDESDLYRRARDTTNRSKITSFHRLCASGGRQYDVPGGAG